MNTSKIHQWAVEGTKEGTYGFRIWRNTNKVPYFDVKAEGTGYASYAQAEQACKETAHSAGMLLRLVS